MQPSAQLGCKSSAFISSSIALREEYGFDGIDIDWEYPAAEDRDGIAADTTNLVNSCWANCTRPARSRYLKGFDIVGMSDYVDWFNFMSYDIHGTWDGSSEWTDSVVNPHTQSHLDLRRPRSSLAQQHRSCQGGPRSGLLRPLLHPRRHLLHYPGCAFAKDTGLEGTGGANPGTCTGTSGIFSDYEITRILDKSSPQVAYDATAGVNWMTWNDNQWVSYDDAKTLQQKRDFANTQCLSGTFAWALDLGGPGTKSDLANMASTLVWPEPVPMARTVARAMAYDHLHQSTGGDCEKCSHVQFPNGCTLTVNYVPGCKTTNSGLKPIVGLNATAVSVDGVTLPANITLPSQILTQSLTSSVPSSSLP
ncbi:glycosyl hydrolases family 18-domain-containing protein [Aspergillus navahoensis]